MERRPRSPTGRNAPGKTGSKTGPKSGLESGFRKRGDTKSGGGNFSTRDGHEGYRSDDARRPAPRGERSDRPPADRPKRDFGDKPKRDFSDKPKRGTFEDRPKRDYADRPKRDFSDKPKRDFGDKPRPPRSYDDSSRNGPPRGNFDDKPKRSYGNRPQRDNTRDNADRPRSYEDRPKRSFDDKPRPPRSYDDRPPRPPGDRPDRGGYSDRPQRGPKRDFGDRPARSFDDKPKRSYGDKPRGPRNFDDRPKRDDDRAPRPSGPRIEVSVYGIHAVNAALANPERKIRAIYATEADRPDIQNAYDAALEDGIALPDITTVEKESFHRALPRDAVHQGVGLDAEPLEEVMLHDIIRKAEVKKKSVVLILDHVTDPHNIGAILRSACAFGADAIVLQNRNAPEMSGLISKTASGGGEFVPLVYETNLSRALDDLKEGGFFALALDEKGSDISEAPAYDKTVLVLGAEGPGLRPKIKEHCDLLVKLPTCGPISSLNVSNAAAISLFAITAKAK